TPMAVFPSYFQDSKVASSRLMSVVREGPADETAVKQQYLTHAALEVEFKNVTFSFPDENRPTLKNISLQLEPGSKTAIVGPSGSGKSTLLQLILNLYRVDDGEILLNQLPLHSSAEESIWEQTNVVLQSNHFFYGTIRSNLRIAKDNGTDEEMEMILKKVHLEHFLL